MDASSRTRAQSGAAPDTSMRPNGSPLPPSVRHLPASTSSSTKHGRPTASRIAIGAFPCLFLLSSSVRPASSCSSWPPERPDHDNRPQPMVQAVRLPSCAASPDMQQPWASVS
ncbi:hypothetical protein TrVFT333_000289 [Trichoderma virens FT-333]|nr:hypothetical protein TrVFT333_000289 [Trichoderma virens FT-333]